MIVRDPYPRSVGFDTDIGAFIESSIVLLIEGSMARLVINNDIEITILDIRGDQVKIGISAPKEVPIYRKEVYLQIQEANKEAMNAAENLEALGNLF